MMLVNNFESIERQTLMNEAKAENRQQAAVGRIMFRLVDNNCTNHKGSGTELYIFCLIQTPQTICSIHLLLLNTLQILWMS